MYVYNKKLSNKIKDIIQRSLLVVGGLLAIIIPVSQLPSFASAKGGGVPGEGVTYIIRYDAQTCPLPQSILADYQEILSCGLVKRTGQNKDFYIRVDGFTQLTPIVRDVKESITVTLPCGNQALVDRFTETAFAQTSPVPPPYRLFTESVKFTDSCVL